ncbi:hypothetical protein VTJ04DRAFT_5081 [Mycothermus thermophilus]|uniref:uncharacterized protein n=1 Tax=Humicola insolens TaxID=85995 RepID=UPI003742C0F9
MTPNPSTSILFDLLLTLFSQPTNAAATPTPQTSSSSSSEQKSCIADPCAELTTFHWEPYCYKDRLHCTAAGLITKDMGRCQDWRGPEPPKLCSPNPCDEARQDREWQPYCSPDGVLYCTIGFFISVKVGRCEDWCDAPELPPPPPESV